MNPIDTMPHHDAPATRPRLGPGAPPLPPYKVPGETWPVFAGRLKAYRQRVAQWIPSHGWLATDREGVLTQIQGALAWALKQKDPT